VVKQAVSRGTKAVNYFRVDSIKKEDGYFSIEGVDLILNSPFIMKSKQVINAAGPWLDTVRSNDTLTKGKKLVLTKGVHIVVDASKFFLKDALYFSTPDGRMIFAIPKFDKVYIGTTDTFHEQSPDNLEVTHEDIEYLIQAVNSKTERVNLSIADVESSWAGLRPLILDEEKNASEISRKDEIFKSPSGMYSIAGGKLTGYRLMSKKILDLLHKETGIGSKVCNTATIQIQAGSLELNKELCVQFPDFDCLTIDKMAALFGDTTKLILGNATLLLNDNSTEQALFMATKAYCEEHECLIQEDDLNYIHTDWKYFNQEILHEG
jgi:glycerol-3-phosphate dehydrogenase